MSTNPADDFEDLRKARAAALDARSDDSLVDAYNRTSIEMTWRDITGIEPGDSVAPLTDTLRVEVLGLGRVPSTLAGQVSIAVQRATNEMVRALHKPESLRVRPPSDVETQIVQEGSVGNIMIFRAPAVKIPPDGGMDFGVTSGRVGIALRELVNALPENSADLGSFAHRIGRAPALERQAVQTMSGVALRSPGGVALHLTAGSDDLSSVLDRDCAEEVNDFLREREVIESQETVEGLLDGFRGTRRVFYLIRDDGREIAGSVELDLLPAVRRLAGTRVRCVLSVTQWTARSGRLGPKHYGLLKVEPAPEHPALFE